MTFETIHPRNISVIVKEKNALIIDVRSREEYWEYHYKSAINCPFEEIECWVHRFPKKRALILYCDYGSTSLLAARRLAREGYKVYTVVGGIHAMRQNHER